MKICIYYSIAYGHYTPNKLLLLRGRMALNFAKLIKYLMMEKNSEHYAKFCKGISAISKLSSSFNLNVTNHDNMRKMCFFPFSFVCCVYDIKHLLIVLQKGSMASKWRKEAKKLSKVSYFSFYYVWENFYDRITKYPS